MKSFSITDIRSWEPCYDPVKYLSEDWSGNVIDILKNDSIPFADRLWCVLRTELISEKIMRLFAVWSYRQTLKFVTNLDPRSMAAAEVAEKFALGQASVEELDSAWSAARSAAESARYAAESAAWSAARYAARYAARSAAESAAWSAARYAARSAAESAARYAARYAARSAAESAARYAARSAAESAQCDKLIEMILEEEKQ